MVVSLASLTQSVSELQVRVLDELIVVPIEIGVEPKSSEIVPRTTMEAPLTGW